MIKRKWLIYTVLIGLLPFFLRILVYLLLNVTKDDYILNEVDMVTFGLVLNLTNINELESYGGYGIEIRKWKTTTIGISVFMLIIFSGFLILVYASEVLDSTLFNRHNIKMCAAALGVTSFILSYSIFKKLTSE